jgi:predicted RNA methylase
MTLRINATHAHAERGLDPYWTPPEATRALLQIERLPQNNWEPACGNGAIAKVLRSAGRAVLSSDIARYDGFEPDFVADYLTAPVPHGVQAVVTNPPFKLAIEFVAKAIIDAPYVALLLRLSFLRASGVFLSFARLRPRGSGCRCGAFR